MDAMVLRVSLCPTALAGDADIFPHVNWLRGDLYGSYDDQLRRIGKTGRTRSNLKPSTSSIATGNHCPAGAASNQVYVRAGRIRFIRPSQVPW